MTIKDKCMVYRDLIASAFVAFVIGCFLQFDVTANHAQIIDLLHSEEAGLFRRGAECANPNVNGLATYEALAVANLPISATHICRFA